MQTQTQSGWWILSNQEGGTSQQQLELLSFYSRQQLLPKDAELLKTAQVKEAVWHFWLSPATGLGGPSKPLADALINAGIKVVARSPMTYVPVSPPLQTALRDMTREELVHYKNWFLAAIPSRISELSRLVQGTPGYQAWVPDMTVESLSALSHWFVATLESRERTTEERQELSTRGGFVVEVSSRALDGRAPSVVVDVGMYLAQVLLHNVPGLEWWQELKSKAFVDYGQPVLVGPQQGHKVVFNPVRVASTLAYAAIDPTAGSTSRSRSLDTVYDAWRSLLSQTE
jgi:hypothetical protein